MMKWMDIIKVWVLTVLNSLSMYGQGAIIEPRETPNVLRLDSGLLSVPFFIGIWEIFVDTGS